MEKKDKNSLLNIHYSRTLTPDNLSKATNYVGEYFLKGLGTLGKFLNAGFTSPTYGTTGQVNYARNTEDAKRLRELSEASEQAMGKAMTWVSPLNYGAAVWNGHGLNAKKGEEEVASWSPAWQAVGRLGELYVGPKAVKGVKATPKTVINTAAKAGIKPAKANVVAREIKLRIKLNTKNGRIEVTENYFNSPDKWYRITETPEKYGIMELGRNVTTYDASKTLGTINGWRSSVLNAKITKGPEGFIKKPSKIELNIRRKNGQAHGNTSLAAKGKLWGGTTSGSRLFPEGVIEGQAPSMINYGIDRTNFVLTPWEEVPNGGRVGFHTGEMPMSNLGWFQRTNKGTYTYEPIIPEKRIIMEPSDDWTLNLPGREDYSMTKKSAYSGYTPTKLNSVLSKFIKDVMQGYRWGRNREIKPTGNKDFTEQLKGKKRLGYGAENNVYEDISNPNQVLKIPSNGLVTPHNTLKGAIREGLFITIPFNRLPYNLPLNVEGAVRTSEGKYIPVFSQRKVYIPLIMLPKINNFDRSVHGMYSYFGKPDINNILSENDIPLALDFKLDNIGLLSDGTVMGIDLWKQGGKMNILEFLKKGSGIHIKKKNRGKFTSYCGGKVTDECIRKAKASGNPTLVKRATFAANARKWKHLNGGILKALLGTNLDVDNLVDTTRKGWGKLPYFGAANNSNTAGLWDLLNYNVTKDPNVITGAPEILPGRVGMLEKEAPTIYNMIVEYGKNIKDNYRGIWNGTNYKNLYDTLRDFFKTGDKNTLTLLENWAKKNKDTFVRGNISESIPKGFIKGNEVTTVGKETASEAGLSIRDTKLGNMNNPPTNPSEKMAVEDWNKMNPNNQISSKLPTGRPSYELTLDGLKIDIRYPKLALPLLKELNSPILKIEQRAPKKTAKERYLERKETPSKNIRKKDSYNLSYEDGDIRHVNSGNRRITAVQDKEDWDALGKYSTFSKKHHNIELRLSKYDKGTPAYKLAWKERKALILEYREKFRFRLKKGGVFRIGVNARKWKHLEGGTIINQSPIVAQYMLWLLNLPYLLSLLMELNLQKKMLDLLEKLLKMETTNSIFNTISNLGTTFLSNYLNKKNGTPSNDNI